MTSPIKLIEVESLSPHPANAQIYGLPEDSEGFQELISSIKSHGVLEPLLATAGGTVLSGCKRLAAIKVLKTSKVLTRTITEVDETAQLRFLITLNRHRKRAPSTMVRESLVLENLTNASNEFSTTDILNGHPRKVSRAVALQVGFPNKRTFDKAWEVVQAGDSNLISLMDKTTVDAAHRKLHRLGKRDLSFSSIIKPSDNWNFSPVYYPRINGKGEHGYVPGDLYANCFWYFVKPGDVVVDPMAGSGMAKYVYERRAEWMGRHTYDFELAMFDLTPQSDGIDHHNLLDGFPVQAADYIFMDLPYFFIAKNVYSSKKEDLANMDEEGFQRAINFIAHACSRAQVSGNLCTVVSPNFTDHKSMKIWNVANCIRDAWLNAGYRLHIETYSSRRIQQTQGLSMANLNNIAKERRLPLTDISVVMTFAKI